MIDVASDLKERFDFAALWFLARYEVLPDGKNVTDLSDEDAKAVEILETLLNSVDAIPPSLIKADGRTSRRRPGKIRRHLGARCSGSRLRIFPNKRHRVRRSAEPNCSTRHGLHRENWFAAPQSRRII